MQDHGPIDANVRLESFISLGVVNFMKTFKDGVPFGVLKLRGPTCELYSLGPSAPTDDEELLQLDLAARPTNSCLWQLGCTRRGTSGSSFRDLRDVVHVHDMRRSRRASRRGRGA